MQLLYSGVVLHHRPYRETSLIVDFLTKESGRVSAVCRGVRGAKSAKSGEKKSLLQPFQPLLLGLSGRHELKNLTQLDSDGRAFNLDGPALFSALYLNELLNRMLPKEVTYPEIYDLYLASLLRLSKLENIEAVLREFEISALHHLGYGFDWLADWQTNQALVPDAYYAFVNEYGFQGLPYAEGHGNCFLGTTLQDINNFNWNSQSLAAAKRITRMAFRPILGDKPLKSRELFQKLEKQGE
ncbi:DNA repair protein RecO [Aliiglaciecola sp. LCG003]|uniref:DNA repair protein RecO n=1 Tax=Aliiglaciecola sp. LCG003 TaxID=3053655 RepID=UPI002573A858|nr:DNA repair protein RecO [Aliiglaciecola sp. LCG003]WJG08717.1 DNA repair protein RecO [Aliiglaciecola sp. LCG003]